MSEVLSESFSKLQNELAAEGPADAVEKGIEAVAIDIVLHVARIEVVQNIEHAEPNSRLHPLVRERYANRPSDLQIEGFESRITVRIPGSHDLSGLIE
jgi:hypothetical protein